MDAQPVGRTAAVEALTRPDLAGIVDLVAHPEAADGDEAHRTVVVTNADGAVRLDEGGTHEVLYGRDPVAVTDPLAFLPYERELADPCPDNERNSYPDPGRRLRRRGPA